MQKYVLYLAKAVTISLIVWLDSPRLLGAPNLVSYPISQSIAVKRLNTSFAQGVLHSLTASNHALKLALQSHGCADTTLESKRGFLDGGELGNAPPAGDGLLIVLAAWGWT